MQSFPETVLLMECRFQCVDAVALFQRRETCEPDVPKLLAGWT